MSRSNNINNASRRSYLPNAECMLYALITVRILLSGRTERLPRNALAYMFPKPYPCTKCNRSYTNKSTLNRHLREECGKKPQYSCPYCNKAFHQRSNFQRHLWTVHRYIVWSCNLDNDSLTDFIHRLTAQLRDQSYFDH